MSEARREAARIPERYEIEGVAESIEPAGDVRLGTRGHECRPAVRLETHEDFGRMAAKNAAKTESLPAQARRKDAV